MISWKPLAIAVFLIACLVVLTVVLIRPPVTSEDVAISPGPGTSPTPPVSPEKPTAPKSVTENAQLGPASIVASTNALLDMWSANLLPETSAEKGLDIEREFAERGFRVISLAGDIDTVAKFKLPFLLPVSQQKGGGYIAVTRPLGSDRWAIAPSFRGDVSLSSEELSQLGMQMAIVPWIDYADIGYVAVPGVKGENVRRLQFLLGLSGCPDVPTDGRYDRRTIACVKQFQSDQGLVVDGLVGPRTLILLYQRAGAYDMPLFS